MFRKIVVPLDLTRKHQKAVQTAADLAGPDGEVILVHVIELIQGLPVEEEKDFYKRLERVAQVHLEQYAAPLRERKVAVRKETSFGSRALEVLRFATEAGADLIVLTAPAIEPGNPQVGLGSLSYKISVFSPCPVLLVKA
jgi:nucleotide-binding universal stress UspA family protein